MTPARFFSSIPPSLKDLQQYRRQEEWDGYKLQDSLVSNGVKKNRNYHLSTDTSILWVHCFSIAKLAFVLPLA